MLPRLPAAPHERDVTKHSARAARFRQGRSFRKEKIAMKAQTTIALAAAALLTGTMLAGTPASAALFSSPAPKAGDSLTLSTQDRETAWNDLSSAAASNAPSSFQPATSSAVPSTLTVHAIPAKTASAVPALRPYDYAKVNGKLLIINPHDMMIAEMIAG
jgi:hypothetical protein